MERSDSRGKNEGTAYLYEITPATEPTFTAENGYMLLHADPTKAVKNSYQMITIDYSPSSVERLYRIGATGDWKSYQEQPIKVNQGETIYAKGIDQYGNETRITSSYTANVLDAISKEAYDGDVNTYFTFASGQYKYMRVDSGLEGKKIYIKAGSKAIYSDVTSTCYISFLDEQQRVIKTISQAGGYNLSINILEGTYLVPEGTRYIMERSDSRGKNEGTAYLYEITPQT